jgi:hypothetical protein
MSEGTPDMGNQHRLSSRVAAAVVACTAAAVLTLAGCGGSSGSAESGGGASPKSGAPAGHAGSAGEDNSTAPSEPNRVLAQLRGEKDVVVTIDKADRDSGGFVTVSGTITNNGPESFNAVNWRGTEVALAGSGPSVAGAVLVDPVGRKRYYVLRDTEGKCLCTMGLVGIQPEESRPFFAQFPAPPASTTEVDFELPTMPPAKIQISER